VKGGGGQVGPEARVSLPAVGGWQKQCTFWLFAAHTAPSMLQAGCSGPTSSDRVHRFGRRPRTRLARAPLSLSLSFSPPWRPLTADGRAVQPASSIFVVWGCARLFACE